MTSPFSTLNSNLERIKLSVKLRKRQRRDWMQRLMDDGVSTDQLDDSCEQAESCVHLISSPKKVPGYKEPHYRLVTQTGSRLAAPDFLAAQNANTDPRCH